MVAMFEALLLPAIKRRDDAVTDLPLDPLPPLFFVGRAEVAKSALHALHAALCVEERARFTPTRAVELTAD